MQFLVVAYDGTDEGALDRRMAVRKSHLKQAEEWYDKGKWLYAAGSCFSHLWNRIFRQ